MSGYKLKSKVGRKIILISSILALNFTGITYANWNSGLDIKTTLSTGYIDPNFLGDYNIVLMDNGEKVEFDSLNISLEDNNRIMSIEGRVKAPIGEHKYIANIDYVINNNGTLPIRYDPLPNNSDAVNEIIFVHESGIMEKNDCASGKLQIEANQGETEEIYEFEFKLPFVQWNK